MNQTISVRLLFAALAALAAAGCGDHGGTYPIDETRELASPRSEQKKVVDTSTRLGLNGPTGAFPRFGEPGRPSAAPTGSGLAWDLPAGWKELPPAPMRNANFAVPGKEHLQCYVSILPGGGGGTNANINRWRKQMGLAELSDAEIAALPRVKVLGVDAPYLEMEGTFAGAAGSVMAAVLAERPDAAISVKIVGAAADVRAELSKFKTLCASLRDSAGAAMSEAPAPEEASDPNALRWTAPESWVQGPAKQMRLVTFSPKDKPGVECYVAVLGGTGGGLEPNINRWRQQLGVAALSSAEIAALPTVTVLGRPSHMVEIEGGASGMFGLVCELESSSIFVKMTGPIDALRAEREHFVAFCKSLT